MQNSILKIMLGAAVALIIPVLGNTFVEGWNWTWHDFIFAWVFWVVMATAILFACRSTQKYKLLVGVSVFILFAAVWVLLATG